MLKLYNSMSRSKEVFVPRQEREVRIFTCGPSTYRRPHIGNYRTFLYEDILVRYLEYLGYEVHRVINFTDVEDKMLEEAVKVGKRAQDIAEEVAGYFFRETEQLAIKLPATIPRASTSIPQAVRLIRELLDKGLAYWHRGNVFFDPLKFKDFGKLFRLDMSRWPRTKVRFKKDTYRGRRWNRGDFILWHGHCDGDLNSWDTEIGRGRPSWNIQDPAMVTENLGFQIDINCGGIDNIYRHHDYNIAVIESISGKPYANYYLHGEHLMIDGKPMSKSRGNILYPQDIFADGFRPYHLRYFLIHTHYRRKLNLTAARLQASARRLESLRTCIRELLSSPAAGRNPWAEALIAGLCNRFENSMNEDLAVGKAIDAVHESLLELHGCCSPLPGRLSGQLHDALSRIDSVVQVLL